MIGPGDCRYCDGTGTRRRSSGPEECNPCHGTGDATVYPVDDERPAGTGGGARVAVYPGHWAPEISGGAPWVSEFDDPGDLVACTEPDCEPHDCAACAGTGAIFVPWGAP